MENEKSVARIVEPQQPEKSKDNDCLAFCNNHSIKCVDCPKTDDLILTAADAAYKEFKGTNIHFWAIPDDDPEVKFWKETWIKGYKARQPEKPVESQEELIIDFIRQFFSVPEPPDVPESIITRMKSKFFITRKPT